MKWIVPGLLIIVLHHSGVAQDFDRYFSIGWNANKPLSNTSWIEEGSARGLKLTYRKLLNDRFAVGMDFSWAVYDEYQPTVTIEHSGGAITSDYFKYMYHYGLTLSGQYFLPVESRKLMPYAGLGLGVAYNRYTLFYNFYSESEEKYGFLGRPEIGVLFPFGGRVGANLSAHYDFSTAASDYFGYSNFSNVGFSLGIVFMSY